MNRKTTYLSAIALIIGSSFQTVGAQDAATSLPANILACADEKDVMRRLSCYDREVAAMRMASAASPDAPATSEPVTETPRPAAESALSAPDVPIAVDVAPAAVTAVATKVIEAVPMSQSSNEKEQPDPQASSGVDDFGKVRAIEDITATVAEISARPYGELIIRLDNGQVWEQKHVDRRFKLRVGETVTVKKGGVTGYRLSGDSNRSIQVQRISSYSICDRRLRFRILCSVRNILQKSPGQNAGGHRSVHIECSSCHINQWLD